MTTTPESSEQPPTTEPPTTAPQRPERQPKRSLVMVNTGDGKGKSTAAFGTMLRAVALGWTVGVYQYLKSDEWKVGEEAVGRTLGVDWWALGDGFTWDSTDMDRTRAVAVAAWEASAEALEAGRHRLLVLDELTYPINWGWLPVDIVTAAITNRHPDVHVIVTGRDAPPALVEIADTVTEMRKIRHAYDAGILAQRGVDY